MGSKAQFIEGKLLSIFEPSEKESLRKLKFIQSLFDSGDRSCLRLLNVRDKIFDYLTSGKKFLTIN